MKRTIKLLILGVFMFLITGCLNKDTMEDITIYTTVYPLEYIIQTLYGEHATIKSIYPNEVVVNDYVLTDKQLSDYGKADLYIYNGLSQEKDYAITMLNKNRALKIIDGAMNMEYAYAVEELWLEPANFLMLARNIKLGLEEYITNPYLKNEITEKYEALKIELSELAAELSVLAKTAENNTIVVNDNAFLFLTKYGFDVISLEDENISPKTLAQVSNLINAGQIEYIFAKNEEDINSELANFIKAGAKIQPLYLSTNLTGTERADKINYIDLMKANLELLKKELYQ